MKSHKTKGKIVWIDELGNTFEIPRIQGSCKLESMEIIAQREKRSLKSGEGGFPLLVKGKYEKIRGIISSVKAVYVCSSE